MNEVHRARMLATAPDTDLGAVVLVEGISDQIAVEVPAARRGRDLIADGISVVPMGGGEGMEASGFFVCVEDLEDELIRCLGTAVVEQVLEAHGDLRSFRIFQKQSAQQGRPTQQQLRRFMGTRSGRKIHYGRWLVEALDLDHVPRPLEFVLATV